MDKNLLSNLKPLVSNSHLWQGFNNYIDVLIEQQYKTLEQSENITAINRSQGSIMALKRLKLLRDEVLNNG